MTATAIALSGGLDSADGTFLSFGPDKNLPQLLNWLDHIEADRRQGDLWAGILDGTGVAS